MREPVLYGDFQLQYTYLIVDSMAKTHNALVEDDPYDGGPIVKQDCVGHVQKRIGSRMCKHRKEGCYSAANKGDGVIGKERVSY